LRRAPFAAGALLATMASVAVACGGEGDASSGPATQGATGGGAAAVGRTARTDRWVALHPSTVARTEVAAARVGGFAYVVGGFVESGHATTGLLERYDLRNDRWRRLRPLPVPVNHAAAAAYRGDLYVLGGYTAPDSLAAETSGFWRYDPARDRWSRMPSAPTRRAALGVAVVGHRLYAAGGAAGGRPLTRLDVFDFATRRWRRGPDMAVPREHVGATAAGGAVYVVGGRPGDLRVAERYRPRRRRWERLPAMRTGRSGIAAVTTADGQVVTFGGETAAGTIRPVERYDARARAWRALPGMLTPRHGLGGATLGRRVFALEGGPRPGFAFSRRVEALDVPAI
jgi:N-acetylneuraminic acid mutarotase